MKTVLTISLILCLTFVFIQDLKERKVFALLLAAVCLHFGALHYLHSNFYSFVCAISFNFCILCFIGMVLFLVTQYLSKNSLATSIGMGDLLFFAAMAIGFPTLTFVVLFAGSLVFSLATFQLSRYFSKNPLIPLAGFQALFLALVLGSNTVFNFTNLYLL